MPRIKPLLGIAEIATAIAPTIVFFGSGAFAQSSQSSYGDGVAVWGNATPDSFTSTFETNGYITKTQNDSNTSQSIPSFISDSFQVAENTEVFMRGQTFLNLIEKISLFDFSSFYEGVETFAAFPELTRYHDILFDIASFLTTKGDDVAVQKLSILCSNYLDNIDEGTIKLLSHYCMNHKSPRMQMEGIGLIAAFPNYGLVNKYQNMSFSNSAVQREWNKIQKALQ